MLPASPFAPTDGLSYSLLVWGAQKWAERRITLDPLNLIWVMPAQGISTSPPCSGIRSSFRYT